jgi:ribonuclease HI
MAPIQPKLWTMYFDGSLMKTGAGAGLLFISPLVKHVRYVLHLHFPASNNVAEYEALVNGLRIAVELGVRRFDACGDSQLVIDQVMKNSHYRDQKMEAYCDGTTRQVLQARTQPCCSTVQRDKFGAWKTSSTG